MLRSRPRIVLLVLALLACLAGAAWADEDAPADEIVADEIVADEILADEVVAEETALTASDLEDWLTEDPVALGALLFLKYGMGLIGLVFLVQWWIRRDRVRAGLLPATQRVEPTTPFELATALALLGAALVLVVAASSTVASLDLDDSTRTAVGMGVLQAILLVLALVIVLRRRQLQAGPHDTVGRAAWASFKTFAVASAFVIPVMVLSVFLLHVFEVPITLYKPVQDVVEGKSASMPWIILILSVVAAPIAEESLFRGMLYPAIRKALGPRHGVWIAAVVTSLLFAVIHWHAASFLPLFTLAMVFALVFERTDSLAAVIGGHALWNASTMAPLLIRSLS